ncbi:Sensor protein ZraS [compost metagenome]
MENSIYHGVSEQSSSVSVTAIPSGVDHVLLQVKDNGSGIDKQVLEQLFTDNSKEKKRGLGIGLSYVNRMLTFYYGKEALLTVDSEPDVGTTVSIIIPRKTKEELHD